MAEKHHVRSESQKVVSKVQQKLLDTDSASTSLGHRVTPSRRQPLKIQAPKTYLSPYSGMNGTGCPPLERVSHNSAADQGVPERGRASSVPPSAT